MSTSHNSIRILPSSRKARCPLDLRSHDIGESAQETMEIKRSGSRPSLKGPAETFTGSLRIDPLFNPPEPARAFGALVTFEPGARTARHTQPLEQTLIETFRCSWTECWGEPKEKIRPGDVIGARPARSIGTVRRRQPLCRTYSDRGKARRQGGRRMEMVSDEQYRASRSAKQSGGERA